MILASSFFEEADYQVHLHHQALNLQGTLFGIKMGEDTEWMMKSMACMGADNGLYDDAVNIFEHLAYGSLETSKLRPAAARYFLYAGICFLAKADITAAKDALRRYASWDPLILDSSEYKCLDKLINACETRDEKAFRLAVIGYNRGRKTIDDWEIRTLTTVQKAFKLVKVEETDLE